MAYSTANSPYLITRNLVGGEIASSTSVTAGFGNIYAMRTTDTSSTWMGTSYVTNAGALGMRVYDMCFVLNEGTTQFHLAMVTAVSSGYATLGVCISTASTA